MREIALDTETTGLDPNSGHRIVEIGCVEMESRIRTGRFFHCYLNPERDMPYEAERIHGLSSKFLSDKPLFASVAEEFVEFMGDSTLVIHNAKFDMKFINHELKRFGRQEISMTQTIDTVMMARKKYPGQPANLDALCRRFNVDLSSRKKHGALLDAELLAEVYLELTGGRQADMMLNVASKNEKNISPIKSAENDQPTDAENISNNVIDIKYRQFTVTDEEKTAHNELLKNIKEPLWGC